jgi:hypothetical protein
VAARPGFPVEIAAVLTYRGSTMKSQHITGRDLRRSTPEEALAPGESIIVKKGTGKRFELKRVDKGAKSMNAGLDQLLAEMPPEGGRVRTNLSRIIIEDRE